MKSNASAFRINNVRRFIFFRLFFNARFYYPVFTILFLDFGLTIEQFAILNAVWAASIVLLEVPSGALADIVGRKNLLVTAGALMVAEMLLLCFAPRGNPNLLFLIFAANRVLSGTAEAAASGADEALAYDSLIKAGSAEDWGMVLEKQMRLQSIGFVVAMSLGAAVYDPALVQKLIDWLGLQATVNQALTLRFPVILTLVMAILTLVTALGMDEEHSAQRSESDDHRQDKTWGRSLAAAFRITLRAGKWIWQTPFAMIVILTGMVFDHCARMVVTLNSQYYRLIELPEASFGLIGSALALLGFIVPRFALRLAEHRKPAFNLGLLTILTLAGLSGITFFWPYWGLLPIVLIVVVMYLLRFFMSHYLNEITDSSQRATVLSFKGLSMNLAYGGIGILYSLLVRFLRDGMAASHPQLSGMALDNRVFIESISWFPWYFLITFTVLLLVAHVKKISDA